jgi:DNA ligase (NAD+)
VGNEASFRQPVLHVPLGPLDTMPRTAVVDTDLETLSVPELEALVRHHNHLYWDRNAPEIPDTEFDRLVRRLTELAPGSPVLSEMGPSGQIDAERYGTPVRHKAPMLSLEKCYGDDELREWTEGFEGKVLVSPKFDGIACSLRYDEKGDLVLAATRGDGQVGDDITANARAVKDIPRKIDVGGREVEIRGEVFMRLSVFARYKDRFANPRNLTAGAIKQKDPKKSAAYELSFGAYELFGTDLPTEHAKLDLLTKLGFDPIERKVVEKDEAVAAYRDLASRRAELDFEIDGVVLKVDRVDEQRRLGATSHHPRYAIAYKFQGDAGTTKLRQVEWSVARTGAITPVALIDPVMLSGAMVGRASLHHPGYIKKLGLALNAEVLVTRRGGVIPNVEHVVKPGDVPIPLPETCPSCGSPVHAEGDFLLCDRPHECRAALMGQIGHFLAVTGIEGFGDRMLGELYDRKLVRTAADLYRLSVDQLLPIERVGDKLAKKLVANVDAHRTLPLETFLRALGIDELGKHVSKILVAEFHTLDRVLAVTPEELAAIHSIGEIIARTVTEGLAKARDRIEELRRHVTLEEGPREAAPNAGGPFAGLSFVFTGKMATLKREDAQERVRSLGGTTPDAVTKATSYLVVGDDKSEGKKSSKEKTADKLVAQGGKLKIISESDFLRMAEGTEGVRTRPLGPATS